MRYFLPDYGVTIEADSIEEAVEKAQKPEKKKKPLPQS